MTNPSQPKPFNPLKWLAIGCGGLFLLGALVVAALVGATYFFASKAVDPKESEKTAQSMADYTIPGGEVGLMNVNLGPFKMAQVASTSKPPDLALTLASVTGATESPKASPSSSSDSNASPSVSGEGDSTSSSSWRSSTAKQMGGTFESTDKRTESKQLCGQTVSVEIEDGKMTVGGTVLPAISYQASTQFKGSERSVLLVANGEGAKDKAESVFNSIQCK